MINVFPNKIQYPSHLIIELTYRCNYACQFCYGYWNLHHHHENDELSVHDWNERLMFLHTKGVDSITISGGEPLTFPNIVDLLEMVSKIGFKEIALFTNASLLDQTIIDILTKYHIVINVSLPGINAYQSLTKGVSIDVILGKIRQCVQQGIDVRVSSTLCSKNCCEMDRIAFECSELGVKLIQFNFVRPSGRMLDNQDLLLSEKQQEYIHSSIEYFNYKYPEMVVVLADELDCKCLVCKKGKQMFRHQGKCRAGKYFFVLGPSGRIRPCLHIPEGVVGADLWDWDKIDF